MTVVHKDAQENPETAKLETWLIGQLHWLTGAAACKVSGAED